MGFPASWAGVRPRARARGAGSGRLAQLPRAPGAGAACPGPVGLGLRAAGRGEENNRRGGGPPEGAGARDAGSAPRQDRLPALRDLQPGDVWVPEVRKTSSLLHPHTPRPGRSPAPQTTPPPLPFRASRELGRGPPFLTWLPAFSPVLVAPPATNGRVGGPAKHRLSAPINPFSTVSGLGPALSPSLQASPLSRGCWGEGRKFLGS